MAQGGSSHGYALFLAEGKLHFVVRSPAGLVTAITPGVVTGAHAAIVRLDPSGELTLALDDQPAVTAAARGLIVALPADGLDGGSDEGGAVGPYSTPNKFAGTIGTMTMELDANKDEKPMEP